MTDSGSQFASAARSFCKWAKAPSGEPIDEAMTALLHLSRLYGEALNLPDHFEDFDSPRIPDEEWKEVFRRFGALPFNYYSMCFNPHVVPNEDTVIADIADDLADIWRDLSGPLALYDSGHVDAAIWNWRQHFRIHWGRHATGAIYALHCWLEQNPKVMPKEAIERASKKDAKL